MFSKFLELHQNEVFVKLLIILLSGLGVTRSYGWITANTQHLKNVSDLYVNMQKYMDIHTIGWFLFLFSILLLLSAFFEGISGYVMLIIGALACGAIRIVFAMISVETANLPSTYYSNMLIGFIQLLVALTGVFAIWKMKRL